MITDRMNPDEPSSAPATIKHFAVQHESEQRRGKSGVRVQERDHRRHIRAADGRHQHHSEHQRDHNHDREKIGLLRIYDQRDEKNHSRGQYRKADDVLAFISDGTLGNKLHFLELRSRNQAARERQRSDNYFQADLRHAKSRDVRNPHVVFRDSDHRRGKRAKRVAQRRPLRHGSHLHHAEGDADSSSDHQRNDDPFVLHHLRIAQRRSKRQRRADLACENPMSRRGR